MDEKLTYSHRPPGSDVARPDSDVAFSRTGLPSPFGTLTEDIKTKVDIETFLAFQRWCVEQGTSPAGHLRNEVYKRVHGITYDVAVSRDAERRSELLFGEGTFEAPNVPAVGGAVREGGVG